MSTSLSTPAPGTLGTVAFKNDKPGSRVAVTLQIIDLVRTNHQTLRGVADVLITPIGLELFAVPIFVKDGQVKFAPSRRDIPHKSDDENEYEYTFGFAAKAHRDIFWDLLMKELETYCQRHHRQSLFDFLDVKDSSFDLPSQGTPNRTDVVRPPSPSGGVYGQRYVDPHRRLPSRPVTVQ